MLVGAWFLIHQHCCMAGESMVVDSLMRRSPLEKNFMRLGRSWPHAPSLEANNIPQLHDNSGNNWDIGQRDIRGKENFIRFGRTVGSPSWVRTRDEEGNRDFVQPADTKQNGLMLTASDLEHLSNKLHSKIRDDEVMFPRMSRSKQNFIRFGRGPTMLSKNKKYSGHGKDSFIRFGRKDSDEDNTVDSNSLSSVSGVEYSGLRETRDKGKSGAWFIRLGKSTEQSHFSGDRRKKRSSQTGSGENRCDDSVEACKSCLLEKTLDPTTLVAPEFSLLPEIPFQHTPLKKHFIRLG